MDSIYIVLLLGFSLAMIAAGSMFIYNFIAHHEKNIHNTLIFFLGILMFAIGGWNFYNTFLGRF